MIEREGTNEVLGQMDFTDIMGAPEAERREPETAEGYDTEGRLINPGAEDGDRGALSPAARVLPHRDGEATEPEARLSELATEINAITEQTRGVVISAALAVGKRLVEAKTICPAGRFGEWLEKSVSYSERKAQDMMRLYLEYGRTGALPESIAALDYSKAVALLGAPAEEREALAAEAVEEDLSVRALQKKIDALKAERLKDQMTIDDLEGKIEGQREEIARLDGRESEYDRAITERDEEIKAAHAAIQKEKEAAMLANAKAAAAEASADELRRLHSDAEDRAAASAQRASDAVNRANRTAAELTEAKAKIAKLEEIAAASKEPPKIVEVVPESVTRELEELRRQIAEEKAAKAEAPNPIPVEAKEAHATATEKFRWFYENQMKPAFSRALELLTEVAKEDMKAADMFATALTKGCERLMNQLGTKEG